MPRPARAEDVKFGDYRARGADAVVVGSMRPLGDGRVEVRFALLDAVKQTQLAAMTYVVTPPQFRATAHRIADVIYEKLTGDAGVFSTRIAYITKQGALRADRRRRRRQQSAGGRRVERAAALARVVARRHAPRLRIAGEQEAGRLRPVARHRAAAGARQFPRQQQRAGVVAGWPPARGDADQGRRLAALPDQRRRHRRAAAAQLSRHRHRGLLHAGRQGAAVRLRPRRHAADLPAHHRAPASSSD